MKKIYSLLAIFLCVGLIAPVCAFPIEKTHMDSWGRTMMFDNGDAVYFGQTVAVTNSSNSYNYEYEVFENCTVTIKTNGRVVIVDENGDRIVSNNGVEFRYTSNCRFTSMTWNNFPLSGGKVEVKEKDYQPITGVLNYLINTYGKSGKSISFRDLPTEITYENMTFTQICYTEPTNGSYANKTQHFRAYYEDLGGYYHIEIEASHPWTGLRDYGFGGYIDHVAVASTMASYQNLLTSETAEEEVNINFVEVCTYPFVGEFEMDETWTEDYTIYHGDVFIDFAIMRLAPAPGSSSN